MTATYNYAKHDYLAREHHRRYARRVEAMPRKLVCQECGGSGQVWYDCVWAGGIIDYALAASCSMCNGTGLLTPHDRGWWLRWKREEKRGILP